jgi:hypothetical protein
MWYTFHHKTEGVSYTPSPKSESDFPEAYLAHWQPQRMGMAMVQLLKRKQYLVD